MIREFWVYATDTVNDRDPVTGEIMYTRPHVQGWTAGQCREAIKSAVRVAPGYWHCLVFVNSPQATDQQVNARVQGLVKSAIARGVIYNTTRDLPSLKTINVQEADPNDSKRTVKVKRSTRELAGRHRFTGVVSIQAVGERRIADAI
jgi:hypothetical protein